MQKKLLNRTKQAIPVILKRATIHGPSSTVVIPPKGELVIPVSEMTGDVTVKVTAGYLRVTDVA